MPNRSLSNLLHQPFGKLNCYLFCLIILWEIELSQPLCTQIRFHILGAHELCDQKATPDNFDGFNPQQNIEQTAKALTSLFDMYNTHARDGVFFDTEPEFRAYYLLLILETHAEHFKVGG